MSAVIVIGVGNEYRGDDAVGLIAARLLMKKAINGFDVCERSGEGAELMETWKGIERAILIDAVSSGGRPGGIYRFEAHSQPIPAKFFRCSTHAFSVAEAVELARALGELPPKLIIYGIEGGCFDAGAPLSSEVEEAAREVVERILRDLCDKKWGDHQLNTGLS